MSLVQVIPIGGCGEIGKNCTAVVQGDDIILIDCGLSFPHEEQYGVDIVIPDFSWVVENKSRIRGLFLTHAHEDHIGAIAYLLPQADITIFATPFTEALLKSKLEEKRLGVEPRVVRMHPGDRIKVGSLSVEPVRVTHSIPETCALSVTTEHGVILFTGDFKFDPSPVDGKPTNMERLAELGEEGVLLLLSDSTNVDRKGWGPSESEVAAGFREIFRQAPGRVLITTFSSNIHRMQQAVDAAKATGRKVAVAGRRMDTTVRLCQSLQYLTIPDGVYIRIEEVAKLRPEQVVVLVTGSQGEPSAALSQMSRGEYTRLKLQQGDTILYSARPIPGNEGAIYRVVNKLVHRGAHVILEHDRPIHVSGHAYQEELKKMVEITQPFYVAPVHGEPRHQALFERLLVETGHAHHRIFTLMNGDVLNIDETRAWVEGRVQTGEVLIDQAAGEAVTEDTLSERYQMAHNGTVIATVTVDRKDKALAAKPVVEVRGLCGDEEDVEEALKDLSDALARLRPEQFLDEPSLKDLIGESIRRSMGRGPRQKPVVVPIVVMV
jgi:ribonuclease J